MCAKFVKNVPDLLYHLQYQRVGLVWQSVLSSLHYNQCLNVVVNEILFMKIKLQDILVAHYFEIMYEITHYETKKTILNKRK